MLRNGRFSNQYDFSDGICIDKPGHLILDSEACANVSTYDGTINCYWDSGIKKRSGIAKINDNPGYDLMARGNCESATGPTFSGDSITPKVAYNGTYARTSSMSHLGAYSYKLNKTSSSDSSIAWFCDGIVTTDLHGLKVDRTYQIEASVYSDVATASNAFIAFDAYYSGTWNNLGIAYYNGDSASGLESWSSSGNLNTARFYLAGCGTQSAGLSFGGYTPSVSAVTEKFNGTSWSNTGSLNLARDYPGGSGTQNSALCFGGYISTNSAVTEKFNGTTWSYTGNLNTARRGLAGSGTQSAALSFGGTTGSASAVTEKFNGTSWSNTGALNTARYALAGSGTQNSGLGFGGDTAALTPRTEKFNGTTWSNTGALNVKRYLLAGSGIQNSALSFGGDSTGSTTYSRITEKFNGTIWTVSGNLNTPRRGLAGCGTQSLGLSFGGTTGSASAVTEKFISSEPYFVKLTSTFTTPSTVTGFRYYGGIVKGEVANKGLYVDDVKFIDVPLSITNGFRHYRSETPEKTTFISASYEDETKILYLDSFDNFQEVTGGGFITSDHTIFFTKWKDNLYCANGDTAIQRISYLAGDWSRENLSGLNYKPQYLVHHKDRLWAAGGNMPVGYLECTAYEYDESWSADSLGGEAFNIGFKDGDPITQLLPLGNDLIIYKNDSIWAMKGDNAENWFREKINQSIGCVAPLSVADVGFGHIFLGSDNVYFFDGNSVISIGNKIKPWLDAIPTDLRSKAAGVYYNNFYRLSFAKSTQASYNDFELILDLKNFKQSQGAKISWWANTNRNVGNYLPYNGPDDDGKLYYCDGSASYIQQLDYEDNDNGDSIPLEFHTKYFTFRQPNLDKIYDRLKIDTSLGVGDIIVSIIKNLNNEYTGDFTFDSLSNIVTFGNAVLGTSYWGSQDNSRKTFEIALPPSFDGSAIAYHIKQFESFTGCKIYGFTISYAPKSF